MFGGLRGVDQRRIQHVLVHDLTRDLVGFFDNSVDAGQSPPLTSPPCIRNTARVLQVRLGLITMSEKALLQMLVGGFFRHFRQRLHKLFLGVIDVLQLMHEQIFMVLMSLLNKGRGDVPAKRRKLMTERRNNATK